jgi:membrane protease YdiL (CAAX protease family)
MEFVLPAVKAQTSMVPALPQMVILGVVNFIAMSLPAMVLMAVFDRKSPMAMGLAPKGGLGDFLTGSVVGGFIFLSAVAAAFFGGWASFNPDFAKFSIMMRGYVLQELMSKFSTATSVIMSSLMFTALHGGQLAQSDMAAVGALNIFLASVLLSLAYLVTRTLWLPIGIHAGWNVMQGPVLGINVSGTDMATTWQPVTLSGPEMMTGGAFGLEASVLGLIGPTLGILMMLAMRRSAQ